jgi:hypothetical protein
MNHPQQIRNVERFRHKVDCAPVKGSLSNLLAIVGGDEDDRQIWPLQSDAALQFDSIHSGHPNVGNETKRLLKSPRF